MHRPSFLLTRCLYAALATVFFAAPELSYGADAIKLGSCYGLNIWDAKSVFDLETDFPPGKRNNKVYRETSDVYRLRILLGPMNASQERPESMVLQGDAASALHDAVQIIEGKKERPQSIQAGKPATAVFYSHSINQRVVIDSLKNSEDGLEINWHFYQNQGMHLDPYFLLIPLGNLHAGEYTVSEVRGPSIDLDGRVRDFTTPPTKAVTSSTRIQVRGK
jgi:hypothetical protein